MRVFVTGGAGWIGRAVVPELIKAGHHVIGLAHSEKSTETLKAAGAELLPGSLDDVDSLRSGAEKADGVIHLAFGHDFSKFAESCEKDRRAIDIFGEVMQKTGGPLVMTSGLLLLTEGSVSTEEDAVPTQGHPMAMMRGKSEIAALAWASKGVRVSVMRLPPSVHGNGDAGFVPRLIDIAREKGESSYVDEGQSRWPSVHVSDAAKLYRLALESAPPGTRLHAVADKAIPIRDIAATIGEVLNVRVTSKPSSEAGDHFGFMGPLLQIDSPSSSAITQKRLGWTPTQLGLLEDISQPYYNRAGVAKWSS